MPPRLAISRNSLASMHVHTHLFLSLSLSLSVKPHKELLSSPLARCFPDERARGGRISETKRRGKPGLGDEKSGAGERGGGGGENGEIEPALPLSVSLSAVVTWTTRK